MKIAVQLSGATENLGLDGAYKCLKDAGFDGADVNIEHLLTGEQIRNREKPEVFLTNDDEKFFEYFRPWKECAEKYGIENYQAHASFPSFVEGDDDYNAFMIEVLKKEIRGCAYIGCRRLIIHPFFLPYASHMSPQDEWDLNIRSYSALIDTAIENGVIICLENMFSTYNEKRYDACCSDFNLACKYIDTLNGIAGQKCFGFCLDTGHALLCGKDIYEAMLLLGERIEAFHIHDNNGVKDNHLAPYMGILDWPRFTDGLRAIGFDKTISFETYNIWNTVDLELCEDMMKFIASAGRMFARRALIGGDK